MNFESINNFILKHEKKILFIIIIVALLYTSFLAINTSTQWGQDSYWYMTLADSLVSGKGYSFEGQFPHSQYPPGFPILLIPFFLIFKNMHFAGIILIALLSILTLLLTYKIGKLINPVVALIATILLLFHNLFMSFTTSILTEIPFAFFSLLSLYLFIQGFEKKKYFLFAFPIIALSCLIRYDGFFLIFPMLFYTFIKRRDFSKLIKTDSVIGGVVIGSLILGAWFLRNFLAFGNPFYTSYSNYSLGLGFSSIYSFAQYFFTIGILIPLFALVGIYSLIKQKNKKFIAFIIWFFSYLIIHSIWGFKLSRFYVEVLPLITIFTSFGLIHLLKKFSRNNKTFKIYLIISILLILFIQVFIFFNPNLGVFSSNNLIPRMNNYAPIKEICEWSNKNLPDSAIYIVPDIPAYSFYLDKSNILDYNSGMNQLLNQQNKREFYLLVDTIHSWITKDYLTAKQGNFSIKVMTSSQTPVEILFNTKLMNEAEREKGLLGQMHKNHSAFVVKIENMNIKPI